MIEHEAKVLDVNELDICNRLDNMGANKILDAVTYIEGYDFEGGLVHVDDNDSALSDRFKEIIKRIETLNADNTMFEQGAYLRLRKEGDKNELIFKQRTESSAQVKSEIEISVPIMTIEWTDVATWLKKQGLKRIVVQEKKRVSYTYGQYRYDIDTWPGIPTYLEVEGPSQEAVMDAVALVGIPQDKAVSLSAAEVFRIYGIENPRRLIFSENQL